MILESTGCGSGSRSRSDARVASRKPGSVMIDQWCEFDE